MKKLKAALTGTLLLFGLLQASAQEQKIPLNEPDYSKPRLFADLPQKMSFKPAGLESLLTVAIGAPVSFQVTDNFAWQGTVVSRSTAGDAAVRTVVIRSSNRPGATFTFTKTQKTDGSAAYLGRIISRNNGDAFEIVQENGQYMLAKKSLYDLVNE